MWAPTASFTEAPPYPEPSGWERKKKREILKRKPGHAALLQRHRPVKYSRLIRVDTPHTPHNTPHTGKSGSKYAPWRRVGFSSSTVNLHAEADGLIGCYVLTVSQRRRLTFGSGPFPPSRVINSLETDGDSGMTVQRHHSFINPLTFFSTFALCLTSCLPSVYECHRRQKFYIGAGGWLQSKSSALPGGKSLKLMSKMTSGLRRH